MPNVNQLILYKHFEDGQILEDMTWIMDHYDNEYYNREDITALLYDCINGLVELAGSHGFEGNLWHNYLTYLLVNNENAFSMACEIVGPVEGSINPVALNDFAIFKELFDFDLTRIEKTLGVNGISLLLD